MHFHWPWILLQLPLIYYYAINAYKQGAPAFACRTMAPGHGTQPQSTPPAAPYGLTPNSARTQPDGTISVELRATPGDYFVGFILQARMPTSEDAIGSFIQIPEKESKTLKCGVSDLSTVTHARNNQKEAIEFTWQAPDDFEGNIFFVATVVRNYTTYWQGVESLPVQVVKRSVSQTQLSEQAKAISAAENSVYEGCGVSKRCVGVPDGCISQKKCKAAVAASPIDGSYQFEMFAKNSQFVAYGLSEDNKMGSDSVVECVLEKDVPLESSRVVAYRSWNVPNRKSNMRIEDQSGISLTNSLFVDGLLYCKLKMNAQTEIQDVKFNLNRNKYFLLLAAGSALKTESVGFHDIAFTSSKDARLMSDYSPLIISDSYYDGCGKTKNCFGLPDGCLSTFDCKAVTSITVQGSRYLFHMKAKNANYVATGLSKDKIMGGETVVECVNDANLGNDIKAFRSRNLEERKSNVRIGPEGVTLLSGKYEDNVLECQVEHDAVVPFNKTLLDLNLEKFYLLLAAGTKLKANSVGFHDLVFGSAKEEITLSKVAPIQSAGNAKLDSFYSRCGANVTCFGLPNSCVSSGDCKAIVAISQTPAGRFMFELRSTETKFVAVGISDDKSMGEDVVMECVHEESGSVKAYNSWNVPGHKDNVRIKPSHITLVNSSFVDGKLECIIIQEAIFKFENKVFDLTRQKYFILLAAGTILRTGGVDFHDSVYGSSGESLYLADVTSFGAASRLKLQLHGSFMLIAWIGLASLGIVIARYYRKTWAGSSICGKDVWFAWHRFIMALVWCLTIAGSTLIYLDVGGIVTGPSETHALLGFITVVLTLIQPIGAFFRPHPESGKRPLFNWLHWFLGNSAHIVAIVTIFLAVDINKAELPKWTDWLLAAFVVFYVVVHLILSVSGCMSDNSGSMQINSFPMKDMKGNGRSQQVQTSHKMDDPYSGFRKFWLTIYVLILIAFTAILLLLVNNPSIIKL